MRPVATTAPTDDFERLRRARETANERIVSLVVSASVASLLVSQSMAITRLCHGARDV